MPKFCPESGRVLHGFLKDKLTHLLFVKCVHWVAKNSRMPVHFLSLRVNENLLPSELDESDVWSGRRDLDVSSGQVAVRRHLSSNYGVRRVLEPKSNDGMVQVGCKTLRLNSVLAPGLALNRVSGRTGNTCQLLLLAAITQRSHGQMGV